MIKELQLQSSTQRNLALLRSEINKTQGKVVSISTECQVSVWQSATLLPTSCNSVQPVPARVEKPVSLARQSSSGDVTNNPPFPKMPQSQHGKVGCQNWDNTTSAYSAAGGEHDEPVIAAIALFRCLVRHSICIRNEQYIFSCSNYSLQIRAWPKGRVFVHRITSLNIFTVLKCL